MRVSYGADRSDHLPWDISADALKTAREGLCGIQTVTVARGALVDHGPDVPQRSRLLPRRRDAEEPP